MLTSCLQNARQGLQNKTANKFFCGKVQAFCNESKKPKFHSGRAKSRLTSGNDNLNSESHILLFRTLQSKLIKDRNHNTACCLYGWKDSAKVLGFSEEGDDNIWILEVMKYIARSFIICNLHQILLRYIVYEITMRYLASMGTWGRVIIGTPERKREVVDGRNMLQRILRKHSARVRTGFSWLRIIQ